MPDGIAGIGTGSIDRFQQNRRAGDRKRYVRIVAALTALALIWFMFGSNRLRDAAETASQTYHNAQTHIGGSMGSSGSSKSSGDPSAYDTSDSGLWKQALNQHPPWFRNTPPRSRKQIGKEKATMVMLVRNQELTEALKSIKQIEDRFNRNYKYPWVFLNDMEFTSEFKEATTNATSGLTSYGLIPKEHWSIPNHINVTRMKEALDDMTKKNVIYGDSIPYRHMCRFNSGFFYRQEAMQKYDWYWRVEPGIGFCCDVDYDPFTYMRENKKRYGFVIALPEYIETVPTLWGNTVKFVKANPQYLAKNNSLNFLSQDEHIGRNILDDSPPEYNLCHFWSNFEIADMTFYRGEAYTKYFEMLDAAGGFFYERWGDAPVHSVAAGLFLRMDELHHFADMGYFHAPWGRMPQPDEFHRYAKCGCTFEKEKSFDTDGYSCLPKWWKVAGKNYGA